MIKSFDETHQFNEQNDHYMAKDFVTHTIKLKSIEEIQIKTRTWDLPCHYEFQSLTYKSMKISKAVLFVYDTTNFNSLFVAKKCYDQFNNSDFYNDK